MFFFGTQTISYHVLLTWRNQTTAPPNTRTLGNTELHRFPHKAVVTSRHTSSKRTSRYASTSLGHTYVSVIYSTERILPIVPIVPIVLIVPIVRTVPAVPIVPI